MATQTKKFDAEIGKVLNIMINSLYTDKEIFLRELVSNASDACDKLRYESQTDSKIIEGDTELKIKITVDKDAKTITILDNGIGMNEKDLNENLGTIAKSGTQKFIDQLSGDKKKDSQLIGQFGVGFYSAFMVADKVTVTSKKATEDKVYTWSSNGKGEYTIENSDREFPRGTEIILNVKASEESFIDNFRLKHIVKNYSDHIAVPIFFVEDGKETQVNSSSALWTKPKSEITEEQYTEFYKTISYATDKPWITLHNHNEGVIEFTNLLFIPTTKTFDLFHPDRKCRVKLYINKVFIADETIDLIPAYLRFIRGMVDSSDLPLNISRQTLQNNPLLNKIKNLLTKRVLSELKKKKDNNLEEYLEFWKNFGGVLKEGLCEANSDHEKLLDVCLFQSALHDKMISLDEYIENCKDDKKTIYYLSGDDHKKLRNNPQIEGFIKKGVDVLLFTDTVDDFWVNVNSRYKEVEIKSVTRSDIDLNNTSQDQKEKEKDNNDDNSTDYKEVVTYFKDVLGSAVKDVKISKKLTSSPACLAVADGSMDIRMERYLIEQKQLSNASAKILEINPNHKIVIKINNSLKASSDVSEENKELVHLLYDQACIIEGEPISDAGAFSQRLNSLLDKVT